MHIDGLRDALFKVRGKRNPPNDNPRPIKSHWCDDLDNDVGELRTMFHSLPKLSKNGRRNSKAWHAYRNAQEKVKRKENHLRKEFKRER